MGVGTARKHASTQAHTAHTACASTPVPRKAPHPAHSHAHVPKKHARTGPLCVPELPGQCAQSSTQARTACASTPVPRKAPTQHTQPHACAQKTHTNHTCAGCGPMRRVACAVSAVHTRTLCAAVTRERAYTATGQRQKRPGNQHPPACTSTANRHGAVAVRAHRGGVCSHTGGKAT